MEEEVKYESVTQDVSNPESVDTIHSVALGADRDYRAMAKVKALVDGAFNEVCKGKINPRAALGVLREDLKLILIKY